MASSEPLDIIQGVLYSQTQTAEMKASVMGLAFSDARRGAQVMRDVCGLGDSGGAPDRRAVDDLNEAFRISIVLEPGEPYWLYIYKTRVQAGPNLRFLRKLIDTRGALTEFLEGFEPPFLFGAFTGPSPISQIEGLPLIWKYRLDVRSRDELGKDSIEVWIDSQLARIEAR